MVSDAIEAGSVNALNYFIAQKYVEAFALLAQSNQQRTVIVPAEMASLVGTLAGIGTLVQSAGQPGRRRAAAGTPPPARPPGG